MRSDGNPVVRVAYGTSQKTDQLYAGEFAILPAQADAFAASGLSYPTKFNLGKTFELDYNDIWFGVPPQAPYGQNPEAGNSSPKPAAPCIGRIASIARRPGWSESESGVEVPEYAALLPGYG